jgi:signal peptidase I
LAESYEPHVPVIPSLSEARKGKKNKSRIREWSEALFIAFIGVMIFRTFFFEAFTIPSSSMEKSLLKGDYILVSKLHYGGRIPMTLLSVPFFHQQLSEKIHSFLTWIELPYARLPGFSKVRVNDIVVFNTPQEDEFPVDQRTYYIKRCLGTPGDTLEIREAGVWLNHQSIALPEESETEYIVKTDSSTLSAEKLKALRVTDLNSAPVPGHYLFELTRAAADSLQCWNNVLSVMPNAPKKGQKDESLFPNAKAFSWNLDHYGPLRIPAKGMIWKVSADSLPLYEKIIRVYEHNNLEVRHDSVFINHAFAQTYTFQMNYYFMLGDNRHYSLDSRYWGFVPEDHLVGKAVLILASVDKENKNWRWDRLFQSIK